MGYRPASFFRRFIAFGIDGVGIYLVQVLGLYFGAFVASTLASVQEESIQTIERAASSGALFGYFFWSSVAWFLNYGVMQGMTGQSLGKRVMSLRVVGADGLSIGLHRSLGRTLAYYASAFPLCAGFFSMLWNRQGQCWHDRLLKTWVTDARVESRGQNGPVILLEAPAQVIALPRPKPTAGQSGSSNGNNDSDTGSQAAA